MKKLYLILAATLTFGLAQSVYAVSAFTNEVIAQFSNRDNIEKTLYQSGIQDKDKKTLCKKLIRFGANLAELNNLKGRLELPDGQQLVVGQDPRLLETPSFVRGRSYKGNCHEYQQLVIKTQGLLLAIENILGGGQNNSQDPDPAVDGQRDDSGDSSQNKSRLKRLGSWISNSKLSPIGLTKAIARTSWNHKKKTAALAALALGLGVAADFCFTGGAVTSTVGSGIGTAASYAGSAIGTGVSYVPDCIANFPSNHPILTQVGIIFGVSTIIGKMRSSSNSDQITKGLAIQNGKSLVSFGALTVDEASQLADNDSKKLSCPAVHSFLRLVFQEGGIIITVDAINNVRLALGLQPQVQQ